MAGEDSINYTTYTTSTGIRYTIMHMPEYDDPKRPIKHPIKKVLNKRRTWLQKA